MQSHFQCKDIKYDSEYRPLLSSAYLFLILSVIIHVAVIIPHSWLSGTHSDFLEHNLALYNVGLAIDLLEDAFLAIDYDGKLILNEKFMMSIHRKGPSLSIVFVTLSV